MASETDVAPKAIKYKWIGWDWVKQFLGGGLCWELDILAYSCYMHKTFQFEMHHCFESCHFDGTLVFFNASLPTLILQFPSFFGCLMRELSQIPNHKSYICICMFCTYVIKNNWPEKLRRYAPTKGEERVKIEKKIAATATAQATAATYWNIGRNA